MRPRALLGLFAFGLAFVVNPVYFAGCASSEESEPEFGEAEMLQLLDHVSDAATWQFESDGVQYELELSLVQSSGVDTVATLRAASPFARTAHACGNRTFQQSASACATFTELLVEGDLTLRELSPTPRTLADQIPVQGRLWTDAARLLFATLDLQSGNDRFSLHSADAQSFAVDSIEAQLDGIAVSYTARE